MGYRVSHLNIRPDPERLKPLKELPVPKCKKELQRVLSMFSYYARWVPNFSEKIRPLVESSKNNIFPLTSQSVNAFSLVKKDIEGACLTSVREGIPFTVECDASEHTVAATINQGGKPVAFYSRTLSSSERKYPIVEKEAVAIMDAVKKWKHYLYGRKFLLITDQRAVAFVYNPQRTGKIKNMKLEIWRSELGDFDYEIIHRPGKDNHVPDTLSRACSITHYGLNLNEIHQQLGHPGVTRLCHFVRTKNLPFSVDEVKNDCSRCRICA